MGLSCRCSPSLEVLHASLDGALDGLSVLSLCPGREWDGEVQHGEPGGSVSSLMGGGSD